MGGRADSTDASTWVSFERAVAKYEGGGYDGIGFVVTADDSYVAWDLDKCFTDDGVHPDAMKTVSKLNSYTEISP